MPLQSGYAVQPQNLEARFLPGAFPFLRRIGLPQSGQSGQSSAAIRFSGFPRLSGNVFLQASFWQPQKKPFFPLIRCISPPQLKHSCEGGFAPSKALAIAPPSLVRTGAATLSCSTIWQIQVEICFMKTDMFPEPEATFSSSCSQAAVMPGDLMAGGSTALLQIVGGDKLIIPFC